MNYRLIGRAGISAILLLTVVAGSAVACGIVSWLVPRAARDPKSSL